MIRKILFPVDFSESCVAMAAYVKRATAIFGAEVTLAHVCDLSSYNGFELYVRTASEISQEHWDLAQRQLDVFLSSDFPAENCPRMLLAGDVAGLISETARKNKFDLIIMPTHAGRFQRMLLGSTTAKVLNEAQCPVLTTQHATALTPRPMNHRRWVCAIDLNSDAERVLRYATGTALAAGVELSLLHAIHSSKPASELQEQQNARQRLAELQSTVGSNAPVSVAVGEIKRTLLDAARQASADILVIGRGSHASGLGRMRDLTYTLIRDSPCPVVSV